MELQVSDKNRGWYELLVQTMASSMGITSDQFKANYRAFISQLKISVPLSPNESKYTLNPVKGSGTNLPGQILLDKNDLFGCFGIGLRLQKADFASGVYSNLGNYPALTYPDPNYFVGVPGSGKKEADCLQVLANGTVEMRANGDEIITGFLAQELFYNPPATYTSSPVALPQFGGSMEERGIFGIMPNIIFDANVDNSIEISVAAGDKAVIDGSVKADGTAATTRNILHVIMYGVRFRNVSAALGRACPTSI